MKIAFSLLLSLCLISVFSYAGNTLTYQTKYNLKIVNSTALKDQSFNHEINPFIKLAATLLNLKLNLQDQNQTTFDSLLFLTFKGHSDFFMDSTGIYNHPYDAAANSFIFNSSNQTLVVTRLWLDSYQNLAQSEQQQIHLTYTLLRELGFLIELRDAKLTDKKKSTLSYTDWLSLRIRSFQNLIHQLQTKKSNKNALFTHFWRTEILKMAQDQLPWYLEQYDRSDATLYRDIPVTVLPHSCQQILEAANDPIFSLPTPH